MAFVKASLSFFPLRELLRVLLAEGRSGVVTIRGAGGEETVRIQEGKFASGNLPAGERSAQLAKSAGLSAEAAERLGELLAATRGRLGAAAVEKKIVTAEQLAALAPEAVTEALVHALLLEEGEVEVGELDERSPAGGLDVSLDAALAAAERRREELAKVSPDTVFRAAGELDLEKVTLTAAELRLLLKIDAKRTVKDLAGSGDVAEAVAVAERLLELKLVERGEQRAAPAAPAPAAPMTSSERTTLSGRPAGGFTAACLTLHDEEKTSFPLFDAEYTLGREASNAIAIPDRSISARHAILRRTPSGYELEDLGSRNGTFVNGERVAKALLKNDDAVRLGVVQMTYTIAEATRPTEETKPQKMGT
jgi:hypothetical protein